MRKFAIIGAALAITAFISGAIAAGHKTSNVMAGINSTALTWKAGVLTFQIDEPFR